MSASTPKSQQEALDAVSLAEKNVKIQQELIDRLAREGADTEPAKRLLADFERVLEEKKANAQRLTIERVLR